MAIDPVVFENKVKEVYAANIIGLSGQNPFAQANPKYLGEFIHSIANTLALDSLKITCITTDAGLGTPPPAPGIGINGSVKWVNEPMLGKIYTSVRNSILAQFGETMHEAWPPTQGSGIYLKAILNSFTTPMTEFGNKKLKISSIHPIVHAGTFVVNGGQFIAPQPNILISDIMGKSPTLKGSFWPTFVKAFVHGYIDYIQTDLTGSGIIIGAGSAPTVGAGTGVLV